MGKVIKKLSTKTYASTLLTDYNLNYYNLGYKFYSMKMEPIYSEAKPRDTWKHCFPGEKEVTLIKN